ncbi:hypothetical protein KCV07_g383, partial [Aureobasidium melanogenum]
MELQRCLTSRHTRFPLLIPLFLLSSRNSIRKAHLALCSGVWLRPNSGGQGLHALCSHAPVLEWDRLGSVPHCCLVFNDRLHHECDSSIVAASRCRTEHLPNSYEDQFVPGGIWQPAMVESRLAECLLKRLVLSASYSGLVLTTWMPEEGGATMMMDNQQPVNLSLINCPVLCRQSSLIVGSLSSRAFGLQTVRRRCRQGQCVHLISLSRAAQNSWSASKRDKIDTSLSFLPS